MSLTAHQWTTTAESSPPGTQASVASATSSHYDARGGVANHATRRACWFVDGGDEEHQRGEGRTRHATLLHRSIEQFVGGLVVGNVLRGETLVQEWARAFSLRACGGDGMDGSACAGGMGVKLQKNVWLCRQLLAPAQAPHAAGVGMQAESGFTRGI